MADYFIVSCNFQLSKFVKDSSVIFECLENRLAELIFQTNHLESRVKSLNEKVLQIRVRKDVRQLKSLQIFSNLYLEPQIIRNHELDVQLFSVYNRNKICTDLYKEAMININHEKELMASYRVTNANNLTETFSSDCEEMEEKNYKPVERISLIQSSSFDLGSAKNSKGKTVITIWPQEEGRQKSCSVRRVKAGCLGGRLRKSLNNSSVGSFTSLQKGDKCKYRSYTFDEKHRANSVAPLSLHRPRSADILDNLNCENHFSSEFSENDRKLAVSSEYSETNSTENIQIEHGILVPVNVTGLVFEKYCRHRRSLIGIVYEKVNSNLQRRKSSLLSNHSKLNIQATERNLSAHSLSEDVNQSYTDSMNRSVVTDYSLHQAQNLSRIDDNCLRDYMQRTYDTLDQRSHSRRSVSNSLSAICTNKPLEPEDYLSNSNSLLRRRPTDTSFVVKRSTSMPLNQNSSFIPQNVDIHKSYHEEYHFKSKLSRTVSIAAKARSMFKRRSRSRSNEGKLEDDAESQKTQSPYFLRKAASVRSKSPFHWLFNSRDAEGHSKKTKPMQEKPPSNADNTQTGDNVKNIRLYRRKSRNKDKVKSCPNSSTVKTDQKYSLNISKTESRISAFFRNLSKRRRRSQTSRSQSPDRLSSSSGQYYSSSYKGGISDTDDYGTFDQKLKRSASRSSAESSLYYGATKSLAEQNQPGLDVYLSNLTNLVDIIQNRDTYNTNYSLEESPALGLQQMKMWLKTGTGQDKTKSRRCFDRYPADAIPTTPKSLAADSRTNNRENINPLYVFGGIGTFVDNSSPTADESIVPPLDDKRLSFLDHWPPASINNSDATNPSLVDPASNKFHSELHMNADNGKNMSGMFARSTLSLVCSTSVAEHLDRISRQYSDAMFLRKSYRGIQNNNKTKHERRTSSGHWSVSTSFFRHSNSGLENAFIDYTCENMNNQGQTCPVDRVDMDNSNLDRTCSKDSAVGLYINSSCSATDKSESSEEAHSGSQRTESSCSSAPVQSIVPSPSPSFISQFDSTPTNTVKCSEEYNIPNQVFTSDLSELNTKISLDDQKPPLVDVFQQASSTETLSPQRSTKRSSLNIKSMPPMPPVRKDSLLKRNISNHSNTETFSDKNQNRGINRLKPSNEIENESNISSNSDSESRFNMTTAVASDVNVIKPSINTHDMSKLPSTVTLVSYPADYQSWHDLLPYKKSNLPQKLSERLKHSDTSLFTLASNQLFDYAGSAETSRPVSLSRADYYFNRLYEEHSPVDSQSSSTHLDIPPSKITVSRNCHNHKSYNLNPLELTDALNSKLLMEDNQKLPKKDIQNSEVSSFPRKQAHSARDLYFDHCLTDEMPYHRLPRSITDSQISSQLSSHAPQTNQSCDKMKQSTPNQNIAAKNDSSLGHYSKSSSPAKLSLSRADSPSLGQYSRLYSLRVLTEFDSDVGSVAPLSSYKQIPKLNTSNSRKMPNLKEEDKLNPTHFIDYEI